MNDPLDHVIAETARAVRERTATVGRQPPAEADGHHPDTPPESADVTCSADERARTQELLLVTARTM